MYDYKEKGYSPDRLGYNPDEGIEPSELADDVAHGDALDEYYAFEKTQDAMLYNDDLYKYRSEKAYDLVLEAIDVLVGAGILEKTADGKVRITERTYKIDLNNIRGRREDFHKDRKAYDG